MHTRLLRNALIALTTFAAASPLALAFDPFDQPGTRIQAASDGSSSVTGANSQDADNFATGVVPVTPPYSITPEAYAQFDGSDSFARAATELRAQRFTNSVLLSLRSVAEVSVAPTDESGSADAQARFTIEFVIAEGQQYEWEFSQFVNSSSNSGRTSLVLSRVGTRGGEPFYDLLNDPDRDPSNDKGLLDLGTYVLEFRNFASVDSAPTSDEDNLAEVAFILNPVPAPSAPALLGLSGLALARRRR